MKKIIKITENDLIRIVKRVIKENEEEWIDSSNDMEDSDFSKMTTTKKIISKTKNAMLNLSEKDKEILMDFLEKNNVKDLQKLVKQELNGETMSIHEDTDSTYKTRRVIGKILRTVGVVAALGMLPSHILISGVISAMLGFTAIGLGALAVLIEPRRK